MDSYEHTGGYLDEHTEWRMVYIDASALGCSYIYTNHYPHAYVDIHADRNAHSHDDLHAHPDANRRSRV